MFVRSVQVNIAYNQNFKRFDIERQKELERFLADGTAPRVGNE